MKEQLKQLCLVAQVRISTKCFCRRPLKSATSKYGESCTESDNNASRWYHHQQPKFEPVRDSFMPSPQISVRKASSRELAVPVTNVWKILRRHLQESTYQLSRYLNTHNVRILWSETLYVTVQAQ